LGINFVELHLNGWGAFRKQTVKGLIQKGLKITLIKENTLFSHNGCRLKKRKRLRRRRQKMYWF
jgi:ribosomal protein S11